MKRRNDIDAPADELETTEFHDPPAWPADEMTAVQPADYAAQLLASTNQQADIVTRPALVFAIPPVPETEPDLEAVPVAIPVAASVPPAPAAPTARSEKAVDDYLDFLRLQSKLNPRWAGQVLIADYRQHPRLLARVLVALHARARHIYAWAELIMYDEVRWTKVPSDLIHELEKMTGDGPIIVRLQICRQ